MDATLLPISCFLSNLLLRFYGFRILFFFLTEEEAIGDKADSGSNENIEDNRDNIK